MNVATFNGRRLDWRALLALVLVPLLVAGSVLAATWHFDDNLHKVQAAVVNNDQMVTIKGQSVPLGRQLSAALVDSTRQQNFTWVLADGKDAADGLASGRYAAVVTIPKEFSAAATSYAGSADAAHQATISIQTSAVAGIAETALGQSVTDAAAHSLNSSLTRIYLDNIYLGFTTMGKQFTTVADGARQLSDGTTKLSDGLGQAAAGGQLLKQSGPQLAGGAQQLSDGLATLASKTAALPSGAAQLSSGAGQLADGLAQLGAAGPQITSGATQLSAGAATWANGMDAFAGGLGQYTAGVDAYVGGINQIVSPLETIVKALPDLGPLLDALDPIMADLPARAASLNTQVQAAVTAARGLLTDADALSAAGQKLTDSLAGHVATVQGVAAGTTIVACPDSLKATAGACDAFAAGVQAGGKAAAADLSSLDTTQLTQAQTTLQDHRAEVLAALDQVSSASAWLATNAPVLQQQWNALRAQIPAGTSPNKALLTQLDALRTGGDKLVAAGAQLNAGAAQLSSGARSLSSGVALFGSKLGQYTDGVSASASGARKLADGVQQLSAGLPQLVSGIGQLASGASQLSSGVAQYTDGTGKLADGITSAASGAQKLADGTKQLADGLAQGAKQIPSYTDAQSANLAKAVASPISTTGLDALVTPQGAATSLLLVLALWLGALATYALIKPVDPRNAASSASTLHLVLRALLPGSVVAAVQAVILGALGAVFLGLGVGQSAALVGVLLLAGLAFAAVNHALAGWAGVWGRLVSGAMLLVTMVTALTYTGPGVFTTLRPLSPLSPALDAVRAVATWQPIALTLVTLLGWLLLGAGAGAYRIARSRTVTVKALALAG